tara:strand:+ start:357 stop:530 length:174 start_codon:yes stop_codon:yes gene_type:complete
MNIINAKYVDNDSGDHLNITVNTKTGTIYVPLDPANTDYQAVLEWAKIDGNTIEEAD